MGNKSCSSSSATLSTAIKLTQSEEILISEAMRTPILSLAQPALCTSYSDYFGFSAACNDRLALEMGRLLNQTEMRARIETISEGVGCLDREGDAFDDVVSVLLCKVVEVSERDEIR
jgi:hypothetical protein